MSVYLWERVPREIQSIKVSQLIVALMPMTITKVIIAPEFGLMSRRDHTPVGYHGFPNQNIVTDKHK